jgi:ABC-type lipoprotein release transport system permease subunit
MFKIFHFYGIAIVSRHRILYLIIVGLLTSSILAASFTTVDSLDKTLTSISHTDKDTLLISDQKAITPFGSRLPINYKSTIEKIPEVKNISLEVVSPIVLKQKPFYLHGVNFTLFIDFHKFDMVSGRLPSENEVQHGIISKNNADKFNINIGDEVIVKSTLRDLILIIKITGIFNGGRIAINNALFINLSPAQLLTGLTIHEISFFRIKFDTNLIDKEVLAKKFSDLHNIKLEISGVHENVISTINIFDKNNELILQESFNRFFHSNGSITHLFEANLPIGEYLFKIFSNGREYERVSLFVHQKYSLKIQYIEDSYNLSLNINATYKPGLFGGILINSETLEEYYLTFNNTTNINLLVTKNLYSLVIFNDIESERFFLNITNDKIVTINLEFNQTLFKNDKNGEFTHSIKLNIENQNLGVKVQNFGILELIDEINNNILHIPLIGQQDIYIPEGIFSIRFLGVNWTETITNIEIYNETIIQLFFPLKFKEIQMIVDNLNEINLLVEFLHTVTNYTLIIDKINTGEQNIILNLPLGFIQVTFYVNSDSNTSLIQQNIIFINQNQLDLNFIIFPFENEHSDGDGNRNGISNKFYDVNVEVDRDFQTSTPIIIVRTVLIAQMISIILLLSINLVGIYIGFCNDNKKEIVILKQLGYSYSAIHFILMNRIYFLNAFFSVVGYFIGFQLINILNLTLNPQIFGNNIYAVLSFRTIVFTIIGQIIVSFISSNFAFLWEQARFQNKFDEF